MEAPSHKLTLRKRRGFGPSKGEGKCALPPIPLPPVQTWSKTWPPSVAARNRPRRPAPACWPCPNARCAAIRPWKRQGRLPSGRRTWSGALRPWPPWRGSKPCTCSPVPCAIAKACATTAPCSLVRTVPCWRVRQARPLGLGPGQLRQGRAARRFRRGRPAHRDEDLL